MSEAKSSLPFVLALTLIPMMVSAGCAESKEREKSQGQRSSHQISAEADSQGSSRAVDASAIKGDEVPIAIVPYAAEPLGKDRILDTKRQAFTATNGASGEYILHSSLDGAGAAPGLLVFLHGSGNAAAYGDVLASLAPIAAERNLALLLVKTAKTESWLQGGVDNIDYLDQIIQNEVLSRYDIDRSNLYFSGASGGAVFLTAFFVPRYGYKYRGGAINLCGGEMSTLNGLGGIYLNEDLIRYLPIFFYTETGDYMLEQVRGGEAYYRSKGLRTKGVYPDGEGHCGFDIAQALALGLDTIRNGDGI